MGRIKLAGHVECRLQLVHPIDIKYPNTKYPSIKYPPKSNILISNVFLATHHPPIITIFQADAGAELKRLEKWLAKTEEKLDGGKIVVGF